MANQTRFGLGIALTLVSALTSAPALAKKWVLDATNCGSHFGGTWTIDAKTCTIKNFSLPAADKLTVPSPRGLVVEGRSSNDGAIVVDAGARFYQGAGHTLENFGTLENSGSADNYGDIENLEGGSITNYATFSNDGTITNADEGTTLVNDGGVFNNLGVLSCQDSEAKIQNTGQGTLKNRDGGLIEIVVGTLVNEDGSTLTNVNQSLIELKEFSLFVNVDEGSLIINRSGGEIDNDGTVLLLLGTTLENFGTFTNDGELDLEGFDWEDDEDGGTFLNKDGGLLLNTGFVMVDGLFENWDGGLVQNEAAINIWGWLKNYCEGTVENYATGVISASIYNYDGITMNDPPGVMFVSERDCVHMP